MKPKDEARDVTILLVEDDDVDAMGVTRALKKLKIANPVIRARDGIEGLAALRAPDRVQSPFMVLLDLNMPRMNGLEMLAEMRDDDTLSGSVVFVLTTSDADQDRLEAYRHNVAGYIVKDDVAEGFLRVVEMLDHYWRLISFPIDRRA